MKRLCLTAAAVLALILCSGPARAGLQEDVTRGYALIDQWRFAEADAHIKSLLPKYPNTGDIYFLQSRIEFYKGNYDRAWELLKDVDSRPAMVREFRSLVKNTREVTRGFVTRETEHFIIRYSDGPDAVLVGFAEEVLEKSYRTLGALLDHRPVEKVRVEIYPDRQPFSRISPLTLKDIMTSGTVALCKYNRLMIISPGSLVRGYNWMDTLSHEYTHFLLSSKSNNNVPLWLHEGLAKYLESRWREDQEHLSPIMETVLADGLNNDYMVALDDMMPSFAKLKTAEDVQLAYAEVATMVGYMVHLKGEAILPRLVSRLAENRNIEEALQDLFGLSLETFQAQWKDYMRQKQLRRIPGLTVLRFQFKKKEESDDPEEDGVHPAAGNRRAQDLTLLGDILKSRQYVEAAIIEYEKAIKESQTLSPVLYNKLAATYISHNQDARAEALLQESLRYYPMFHTTLTNLGEVYFLRREFPKALDYFRQAEQVNPFNPLVHARLISLYSELNQAALKDRQVQLYQLIK